MASKDAAVLCALPPITKCLLRRAIPSRPQEWADLRLFFMKPAPFLMALQVMDTLFPWVGQLALARAGITDVKRARSPCLPGSPGCLKGPRWLLA